MDPETHQPAETSPYTPPGAEIGTSSPERSGGWKKYLFWGCLGMAGLVVLPVAACAAFLMKRGSDLTPACEAYLSLTQAGRYQEAYEATSPSFREAMPKFEDYLHFEEVVRARMGLLRSKTRTGVQVFPKEAHLVYSAQFEKGPGTIFFNLVNVGGVWRVQAVKYNAAQLNTPAPCPSCGSRNTILARHCSACGAPMGAATTPGP